MGVVRWGQAKREIIALKPLIIQRLEAGETRRQIWLDLSDEGKISVAQANFYAQVNKLLTSQTQQGRKAGAVRETAPAASGLSLFPTSPIVSAQRDQSSASEELIPSFHHSKTPTDASDW